MYVITRGDREEVTGNLQHMEVVRINYEDSTIDTASRTVIHVTDTCTLQQSSGDVEQNRLNILIWVSLQPIHTYAIRRKVLWSEYGSKVA